MIVLDTLANIGLLFFLFLSFGKVGVMEGDDEVDAKADDFINRFKQQLKLQRLDSIIRFKDASNRGNFSLRACSEAIVLFSGLSEGMREINGVKKKKRYGGFEEVVIMDVVAWGGHVVSAWSAATCLGLCKPRR
jgi:hypothetical protein